LLYAALDIRQVDGDLLLAAVDDYSPTAVEERDGCLTVFFPDQSKRDGARQAAARAFPLAEIASREVDDEDWARRSQQGLDPITVGRVTVFPGRAFDLPHSEFLNSEFLNSEFLIPNYSITIPPSMGFGTGHHATTRLCLAALQAIELTGLEILDVGTGSGILAIAAQLLGARKASGIDTDPDAIHAAEENLLLNPGAAAVSFAVADLRSAALPPADVVTANLTGALLERAASSLIAVLRPGGRLVVSGLMVGERAPVVAAFAGLPVTWESEDDGWLGLIFGPRPT
jgi:ribosomal protein L11 methyltransferase